jgi:hypothetical protein
LKTGSAQIDLRGALFIFASDTPCPSQAVLSVLASGNKVSASTGIKNTPNKLILWVGFGSREFYDGSITTAWL